MQAEGFFTQAAVYLGAAVVAVPVAKKLGLGSVLGYLLAGIAIGPFALGLVGEEGQDVMHFAEFGVVMMLFLVGLELKPSLLWKLRGPILGLGGSQVLITSVLGAGVGLLLGLDWRAALAIGLILSLSSTAIALQALKEKGLMPTQAGQRAFSVLLFQDLAVIPMLAVLPMLAITEATGTGGHAGPMDHWPGWMRTLATLGSVGAIVVGGRFVSGPVFRMIANTRLRELFTAAALLLIIGIAIVMEMVGLSPALGTFVAGVVLAESEYRHELESDIDPFKGLLLGLFFIAVGASIDFGLVSAQPGNVAALLAILMGLKLVLLLVLGKVFKLSLDQNLTFAFALAQGGEFAFVLFSYASGQGVLGVETTGLLTVVVALSMALTPLAMIFCEKLLLPRFGTRESEAGASDTIDEKRPVIVAGVGSVGGVILRLLRANGHHPTVLEHNPDTVDLMRRLGFKVYYGDATRHDLLETAGIADASLVVIALDDSEKILEMVHTINRHWPGTKMVVRARSRRDSQELQEAGVKHVFRETFESSLKMGVQALRELGVRGYQAERSAAMFRRRDEQSIRDLGKSDKGKAYLSRAKQYIVGLEEQMLKEIELGRQPDPSWDPEALREDVKEKIGKN